MLIAAAAGARDPFGRIRVAWKTRVASRIIRVFPRTKSPKHSTVSQRGSPYVLPMFYLCSTYSTLSFTLSAHVVALDVA